MPNYEDFSSTTEVDQHQMLGLSWGLLVQAMTPVKTKYLLLVHELKKLDF